MTSLYATVNDSGDLFMLSECRVLIGKRVKVCKRKKNGLYIVYDEETKVMGSLRKRNLDFEDDQSTLP